MKHIRNNNFNCNSFGPYTKAPQTYNLPIILFKCYYFCRFARIWSYTFLTNSFTKIVFLLVSRT